MGELQSIDVGPKHPVARFLFHHEISGYPTPGKRHAYLALTVLATIALYYGYYTQTGVTPEILTSLHMSFGYYVGIAAVSNLLGAGAALLAAKTDSFGRSNVVIYGLLVVGLLACFGVTNAQSQLAFALVICAIGIAQGAVLVASAALVRDFSPQIGRASAMGFWTVGPVAGSLLASVVASRTLEHFGYWQSQFWISGIFALVVFVIAVVFLKDLSLSVRDQLMLSEHDTELIEAKAAGLSEIEIRQTLVHPWRQIFSLELLGSALGISLCLLIYLAGGGIATIYYVVTFVHSNGMPFSTTEADSLNQWFWGADVVTLVLVGWLSDRLEVRKPFMLLGALMGIGFTFLFLTQANHPHTSFRILAFLSVMIATSLSLVFAPWVAGFTEMVEAKNPALVAHGLAMWGGIQRVVVAVVFLLLPVALPSVNAVIDNQAVATAAMPQCNLAPATRVLPAIPGPRVPLGTTAVNFQVLHPDSVVFAQRHSALLKKVVANYRVINAANAPDAPPAALIAAAAVMGPKDTATLLGLKGEFNSLVAPYACQLNYLAANEVALSKAQEGVKESPLQWQTWFWMCIGGMVAFIPLIFLTKGRWSPKKARGDFEAGEHEVDAELEKLTKTQG